MAKRAVLVFGSGRTAVANGKYGQSASAMAYGTDFDLDTAMQKGAKVESITKVNDTVTLVIIEEGETK
jgi:hypothetical protein